MRIVCIGALAFAVGAPGAAQAQADAEFNQTCFGAASNAERTIAACSAVIAGGSVDPKDLGAAFKIRGNAYDDSGQYDRAIEDYGHAIAINPGEADVFNNRGATYGAQGKYDVAILDYDRALAINPTNAMALSNRCFAKAAIDQLTEALADCNESLRLRPADANTLASRGFAYLKMGRADAALADYDIEIRAKPGNPYSLFGRGVARHLKGDLPGSDADIAAAKAINADVSEAMAKLGVRR